MSDDTKACPACGETIKAVATKCRFCGTDLAALAASRESEVERDLFVGHPAVIYHVGEWAVVILTLGIAYLAYWFRSRSTRYQITNQRIRIERGLFSTLQVNVELFRIDDYDVHKPLGMRLVGQCQLHLRSSDPGQQEVVIGAIPNLEQLADALRECSLRERTRRRVTTLVDA